MLQPPTWCEYLSSLEDQKLSLVKEGGSLGIKAPPPHPLFLVFLEDEKLSVVCGRRGWDVGPVEAEGVPPPQSALTRLTSPPTRRTNSDRPKPPPGPTQIAHN